MPYGLLFMAKELATAAAGLPILAVVLPADMRRHNNQVELADQVLLSFVMRTLLVQPQAPLEAQQLQWLVDTESTSLQVQGQ